MLDDDINIIRYYLNKNLKTSLPITWFEMVWIRSELSLKIFPDLFLWRHLTCFCLFMCLSTGRSFGEVDFWFVFHECTQLQCDSFGKSEILFTEHLQFIWIKSRLTKGEVICCCWVTVFKSGSSFLYSVLRGVLQSCTPLLDLAVKGDSVFLLLRWWYCQLYVYITV